MPNQYKNKVIYGDSVLMDITDTTAEAGDVASGDVFYAANGARTVGTAKYASSQTVSGPADKAIAIPTGKVDSTSTSTAFTATIEGITELRDGVCVMLTNGVVTSAEGCTLNINDLGAKRIYNSMAATTAVTTTFNKNYTMLFIYNSARVTGGCWDMYYGYNANTTYTNASLGQGYATCTTAEATTAKVATLSSYALTAGGYVAVKFSYDVPANSTLNVNSKGAKAMYYRGAAITDGIIKANDVAVFIYSTYYHLVAIDRWGVDLASCATTQYVNDAIANINAFNISIVQSLPTENIDAHTIYFIPNSGTGTNVYDEYMYINNAWEKIGTTDIDLTGYATEQYVDGAIEAAQVQSDWEEDDNTDSSYILNKPPIIAGDGENSIIEGQIEQAEDAAIYTLYVTGEAKATSFNYTTIDTLPDATSFKAGGIIPTGVSIRPFAYIVNFDAINQTIELSTYLSTSAITNQELLVYYRYKNAFGSESHAEGKYTIAGGQQSHAEGVYTNALSNGSHAEGISTTVTGSYSHAEGYHGVASGTACHVEGQWTTAAGSYSHVEGNHTIASSSTQHVQGKYNIEDANGVYADIVGNGTSSARANAYTLDWSGNGWFAGKVSAGTVATPASVTNANDLTTKAYVDSRVMVVTFSEDPQDETAYIMDTTVSALVTHYNSGGNIVATDGSKVYQLEYADADSVLPSFRFSRTDMSDTGQVSYYGFAAWLGDPDDDIYYFSNYFNIPSASSSTPLVDGTAAVGSSDDYARADHVHPKITQTISMSNNVITLTGSDGSTSSVTLPVYNGGVQTVS